MTRQLAIQQAQQDQSGWSHLKGGTLQRKCASCGNHTLAGDKCSECRKKKWKGVQTKLKIGDPDDAYEREADRIADQVMAMPTPVTPNKTPIKVQRFSGHASGEAAEAPPSVERVLNSPGKPLPPDLAEDMGKRFGHDFSGVRIHTDSAATQSARDVTAHAYTGGHSIIFAEGQYAPGTIYGKRLLAHELSHVVQQRSISKPSSLLIQRQTITFQQGETTTGDPLQARRTYARIRESVQHYSDNSLDYFTNQYRSAMTSFRIWYNRQPEADASFFNSVVNIIMNTAWAWGNPLVGAVVAPVGSIIMLAAQEAASIIQDSRNGFADSLIRSANNFQASMQRRLSGNIPEIVERGDPTLWEEIQRRAYLGEQWQPLLHQRAGLPKRGINYQTRLLSRLIFEYRRWELSNRPASYRGAYSIGDPYLTHMRNRARAEAYIESGLPIPRELSQYSHPGEIVER